MVLNVNTNLGITGQTSAVNPQPASVVGEDELTKVAQQILSSAPKKITTKVPTTTTNDVNLFAAKQGVDVSKQVATGRTSFDVSISQAAQSAISALNVAKLVDGRIHVNTEKADITEIKEAFAAHRAMENEVFGSANLSKDRRGPGGGFYMPIVNEEEEETAKEGLNLVI